MSASPAQGRALRFYLKNVVKDTITTAQLAESFGDKAPILESKALPSGRVEVTTAVPGKRVIWASPSVGFDVFVREGGSGSYKAGIIPGVGYGLKWGRRGQSGGPDTPYISVDLFIQGAVSEEIEAHSGNDYFNIDVLPVVTFFNWVSIGYGVRVKTGLDGLPGTSRSLFSFGVRKGT